LVRRERGITLARQRIENESAMAKKAPKSRTRSVSKRVSTKRSSSKRELIDTGTDKRYVRRNKGGQFKESDNVGRSLSADRRTKAKTATKSGQGDRGDRKTGTNSTGPRRSG
jgi:hypothetical protein